MFNNIAAGLIALMVVGTISRNEVWRSEKTLWADAVLKSPQSARARLNLAREYQRSGNVQIAFREYQEAMRLANERHDWEGRNILVIAQTNLGSMLIQSGRPEDGESMLQANLTLMPYNGPTVVALSHFWNIREKYGDALSLIEQSLQHGIGGHQFGAGFTGLGRLYFEKGVALCGLGLQKQSNAHFNYASKVDADIQLAQCQ